jgi:hypothetical protein
MYGNTVADRCRNLQYNRRGEIVWFSYTDESVCSLTILD